MDTNEIKKIIKEILEKIHHPEESFSLEEGVLDEKIGGRCFSVQVSNPHYLISRNGEGLAALNHLVRRMIEAQNKDEAFVTDLMIDVNGFQKQKIENLKNLVYMMAERARYFKSSVELEPMSSYERRIVHEFLSDALDLKSESEGVGKNRRVVIKYVGNL